MQQHFEAQIQEVLRHYETSDHGLALRRLLDCAIETQNPEIFSDTLSF